MNLRRLAQFLQAAFGPAVGGQVNALPNALPPPLVLQAAVVPVGGQVNTLPNALPPPQVLQIAVGPVVGQANEVPNPLHFPLINEGQFAAPAAGPFPQRQNNPAGQAVHQAINPPHNYIAVVGPVADTFDRAEALARANVSFMSAEKEAAYQKYLRAKAARRQMRMDVEGVEGDNNEIHVTEIRGHVDRSGIHGLPDGRAGNVFY